MAANASLPSLYPLQYSTNFEFLAQQMQSRLSAFATFDPFDGKSKDYNQIGKTAFQSKVGRATPTVVTDTPFSKYRNTLGAYDKADRFDEWDEAFLGQIVLPKSEVMTEHVYAWNRLVDLILCRSALGSIVVPTTDAYGIETTSSVVLPSGQKVAVNYVETGSAANSGLTIGKLRQAKFILDDADNDPAAPTVMAVTAKEIQNLLRTTEITDSNYNTVKALAEGKVDSFLGFKFVQVSSVDVLPAVAGIRYLPAWKQGGVKYGTDGPKAYMDILPEHSHALQLRHSGRVGATRTENVKVVEVAVDTTA